MQLHKFIRNSNRLQYDGEMQKALLIQANGSQLYTNIHTNIGVPF